MVEKKLKLNKNQRMILIIVNALLICILAFAAAEELLSVNYKDGTETLFNCENKAGISYDVFLKPNSLYETPALENGKLIITEFVDYIQVHCNYQYNSGRKADIDGNYEIRAILEGYTGQGEETTAIWNKEYVLKPRIDFAKRDADSFTLGDDTDIRISTYNEFVSKINEESKITANAKLTVFMNTNIRVETDEGTVEESLSPNIIIPLNTGYFSIGGTPEEDKPGSMEEAVRVRVPVDYGKVYTLTGGSVLLILSLLFLLFFTRGTEPDAHEKLLNQIFRKHGDRMVALISEVSRSYEFQYEVKSIEDLVRISDEVEKPVLYQYQDDRNGICRFYVLLEKETYYLDIKGIENLEGIENIEGIEEGIDDILPKSNIGTTGDPGEDTVEKPAGLKKSTAALSGWK